MPPTFPLGNDTITILRAAYATDPGDNTSYWDWDNATEVVVSRCNVQPFRMAEKISFEATISRDFSRTSFRVWAPAGTDVQETDRVLFDGVEYEVFGGEGEWREFSGVPSHVQFMMRERVG